MRRAKHSLNNISQFTHAVIMQLKHIIKYKILLIKNRQNTIVECVYFYPELPHPYTVVYKIFHIMGIQIRKGLPKKEVDQVGFWWKDDTFVESAPVESLINGQCLDISKENVEKVHQKIFGYSLAVDPLQFDGKIVIKSNLNGAHNGVELRGPILKKEDKLVYQRAVDNRPFDLLMNSGYVCDIRIAIFGHKPLIAYLKYRPLAIRFSNKNTTVRLSKPESVLNQVELESICSFAQEIGLDYGEIDIVRDFNDKKIYVLDINKTPLGPPNGLSSEDEIIAVDLYKNAFIDWMTKLLNKSIVNK